MKIYIFADLEGATAVTGGWGEICPSGREFVHAKKMLTRDVNACAKGAYEAGADDIVVFDWHGMMFSIDPVELDPRLRLIQGRAFDATGLFSGLDSSFDAVMIIGIHAMEGTSDGVMNSTVSSPARFWINGKEVGETGIIAVKAGQLGIPVILVTGDEAVKREAMDIIPGVYTVAVKKGLSRYSAEIINPEKSWEMITETTREAVKNYKKVGLYDTGKPLEVRMEYCGDTQLVDGIARLPGVKRINGYTVSYTCDLIDDAIFLFSYFSLLRL